MKEMSREELIKWDHIFADSPWRMFIEVEDPVFDNGQKARGSWPVMLKGSGKIFPCTGLPEVDALEVVASSGYSCKIE